MILLLEFYWKEENKKDSTNINGNIYFIYIQNIAIWKYLFKIAKNL